MADRHLTDRQKAILVSALRPFHGNQVEFTVYFGGSPAAYHFAEDFVAVFRQSEFTFRIYNMGADKTGINRLGNLSGAPPLEGILVTTKDPASWQLPMFAAFAKARREAGIDYSRRYDERLEPTAPDRPLIIVGSKPSKKIPATQH